MPQDFSGKIEVNQSMAYKGEASRTPENAPKSLYKSKKKLKFLYKLFRHFDNINENFPFFKYS